MPQRPQPRVSWARRQFDRHPLVFLSFCWLTLGIYPVVIAIILVMSTSHITLDIHD